MNFHYLNISKSREFTISEEKGKTPVPGRRNFIRTVGLGALAWNPLADSIKSLSRPFQLKHSGNRLSFYRNNQLCWEFSERIFEKDYTLAYSEANGAYLVVARNLRYKGTAFRFSVHTQISYKDGNWGMEMKIPELGIAGKVNFLRWLDGNTDLRGSESGHRELVRLNRKDSLIQSGRVISQIDRQWNLSLSGEKSAFLTVHGEKYALNRVKISPVNRDTPDFIRAGRRNATLVTVPDFEAWPQMVSNLKIDNCKPLKDAGVLPDLNIIAGDRTLFWVSGKKALLSLGNPSFGKETLQFRKYFYYAEYFHDSEPKVYFSASLAETGQWFSTRVGSFKFEPSGKFPDFEAWGEGGVLAGQVIEPRLKAFHSHIDDGISLRSVYGDKPAIRIDTQEPVKKASSATVIRQGVQVPVKKAPSATTPTKPATQEPVRKTVTNVPQLDLQFEKIRFKPKRALTIRFLRPEDMILLEFEFHNFNFTNRGQAPYLELDNNRKNGVVIIYFTSQHTLEEAFFESNQIPGTGTNTEVKLPAKHLRARRSRLVYELPAGHDGFPVITEELLDWSKFKLVVHPRAWIKLPQVIDVRKPSYTAGRPQTVKAPSGTRFMDTGSKEYAVKMVQNSKVKADQRVVYDEAQLTRLFQPREMETLRPAFNLNAIKGISLKVAPIPDFNTSIEAPALMYISPNQINDFYHQRALQFRDTEERRIQKGEVLSTQLRVLDPLATTKGQVAELWHTALGVRLQDGKTTRTLGNFKTIRALWADEANEDYKVLANIGEPFMASLDASDRHILVHTTSNYSIDNYSPKPVPVKNLMLTSLGAYLDWHAFFDVPSPADNYLNIIEWEHLATLGRDHYVKVVREGYLFPFGHRAALVKVTERKFHKPTKSAVNRQRMYIVVLEKEVLYSRTDPQNKFIRFPFQAVRVNINTTPDIDNPMDSKIIDVPPSGGALKMMAVRFGGGGNTSYNFYIQVGNKGFPFDLTVTDKEGLEHAIRMPLAFLENRIARDKGLMQKIIDKYNPNITYTKVNFSGQDVAYAESLVDGDTAFETDWLNFGGQVYPATGAADLKFHPIMQMSSVFIKQLDEMTGSRKAATIQLEDDQNAGMVFATVAGAVVDFSGGSDKAGGFLSPNMAITALSKLQGPVGGVVDDLKALTFNPDKFFEALEEFPVAKIFGVIRIFDLLLGGLELDGAFDSLINTIKQVKNQIEDLKNQILALENQAKETAQNLEDQINSVKQQIKDKVQELLNALNGNVPKIPNFKVYVTTEAFYAEYKWQPEFKSNPIKVIEDILHVNVSDPNKALTITTKFEKPFDASKPAALNGSARFEKFGIDLVPLLEVNFNYLEFKTGSSQKTDVKVDIDAENPIKFKGALSFVNNLQSIIPSSGFSDDGPYIKLEPTKVVAGFNLAIPNVTVGVCMITNISLGADVTLPFTGAPLTIGFNFCTRENPFLLTVSLYGGGGFFRMVTTLKGLQSIEAAFEFGAAVSLNVGVASGGVSVMGGFYFKMLLTEKVINGVSEDIVETTLTGYLRINGSLCILGLITVSLEFYLAFTAVFVGDKVEKLEGIATLKVKVEVLFFSKTVSVTVRRELKGADADPKFIEMVDEDDWQEYCLAFAG
ncbi:MAG: hypothetical protein AB7V25_03275 [Mangrovibacterium sp.]